MGKVIMGKVIIGMVIIGMVMICMVIIGKVIIGMVMIGMVMICIVIIGMVIIGMVMIIIDNNYINHNKNNTNDLTTSSSSPLCRVFILIFLTQTMSPDNTVLQLFCSHYSWCI
jgi:hypothetical protein